MNSNVPFEVTNVSNKTMSVTDRIKLEKFKKTSVLPMPQNRPRYKHDMNKIKEKRKNISELTIPIRKSNEYITQDTNRKRVITPLRNKFKDYYEKAHFYS